MTNTRLVHVHMAGSSPIQQHGVVPSIIDLLHTVPIMFVVVVVKRNQANKQ